MSGCRYALDVISVALMQSYIYLTSAQMVVQQVHIRLTTVHEYPSCTIDDRHTQPLIMVLGYIRHEGFLVEQLLLAQGVHHLIVIHLQASMEDVYLVLFLTLILIDAETQRKKYKNSTYAKEDVFLKTLRLNHMHKVSEDLKS